MNKSILLTIGLLLIGACTDCTGTHLEGDTSIEPLCTNTFDECDVFYDNVMDFETSTDSAYESDSVDARDDEIDEIIVLPPIQDEPVCGNYVLDDGEECDDGNRLDGDGCDWSCHVGDGDPPPDPDMSVDDYVPAGDPATLPGAVSDTRAFESIALVWTGTEYAAAWTNMPGFPEPPTIEFRRFDMTGTTIDAPWHYDAPVRYAGLDLVWNGDGFGLFYVNMEMGLFYLRLDSDGKPLSAPVLIEPDPRVRAPAADLATGGYIVAWNREMSDSDGWSWCSTDVDADKIRMMMVDFNGSVLGAGLIIGADGQGPPAIATGESGFGIVYPASGCAPRFMMLSQDLSSGVSTGVLGYDTFGDIEWTASGWAVAWPVSLDYSSGEYEYPSYMAVASFSIDGFLEGPPVLNAPYHSTNRVGTRIVVGDGGFVIAWSNEGGSNVYYLRTDSLGVAVGPVHEIVPEETSDKHYGPYSIAWSEGAFAVLYQQYQPEPSGLYLRHYIAEE